MANCKVAILSKWTLDAATEFAEVLSAYDAGEDKMSLKTRGRLIEDRTPYKRHKRTVTAEGIHGGSGGKFGPIEPPKYPPAVVRRHWIVPHSIMDDIAADDRFVIIAVDDTGDGIPEGYEGMGWEEPMDIEVDGAFRTARGKLRVITNQNIGTEEGDQVHAMLNNFRDGHPGFTPCDFTLRLRRFTS